MMQNTRNGDNNSVDIPFDVYGVIRSAEIREYFRKNDCMGIFEKEQIILHSFTSIQQKTAMLERLSHTGSKEENRLVGEMYRLYRKCTDLIFHPQVRTIFFLEYVQDEWEDRVVRDSISLIGAYDTVEELTDYLVKMEQYTSQRVIDYHGEVSVVQIPDHAKLEEPFSFTVYFIDGRWQVANIILYGEKLERERPGISKDTVFRFNYEGYHPLPFENGTRLKVQMPFMKEPVYGVLWSQKDGNGCWYHWLYPDEDCINLTYLEHSFFYGYSSLDWIERA